jgi:hypothetical protein
MSTLLETLAIGVTDSFAQERIEKMLATGAGSASNTPSYVNNQIKTNIKWFNSYEKTICNFLKLSQN